MKTEFENSIKRFSFWNCLPDIKIAWINPCISNSIHTFTELLTNNNKHFFEGFNGHLNRQKILKEKIPEKK